MITVTFLFDYICSLCDSENYFRKRGHEITPPTPTPRHLTQLIATIILDGGSSDKPIKSR